MNLNWKNILLWKNTTAQYGLISKLFHWAVFLVLIALIATAQISGDMPRGPEKTEIVLLHASLGFLMLNLMILRLCWRWFNVRPAAMNIPEWQKTAALAAHISLYALIIAQALTGVTRAAAKGLDIPFFGLFQAPVPLGDNEALKETLYNIAKNMHEIIPWLIVLTLALHIFAALYHHFKLKDDTLRRMTIGIPER